MLGASLFADEIRITETTKISIAKDDSYFVRDNAKKVVLDSATGLMWQDDSRVKQVERGWQGAKAYCKNLNFAGFGDWYLPDMKELSGITEKKRKSPAVYKAFKNIRAAYYWSSSEVHSSSGNAWDVDFKYGYAYDESKSGKHFVRCVRAGQSTLTFDDTVKILIDHKLKQIHKPNLKVKLVKEMFETQSEFDVRVKKAKAAQKAEITAYAKRVNKAKRSAEREAIKEALEITWGKPLLGELKYDADNGYFVAELSFEAKKDFRKKVAIKVPRSQAKAMFRQKDSLNPEAVFDYDGKSVTLKSIEIPFQKKIYTAQFTDHTIDDSRVAVNITSDLDVNLASGVFVSQGDSGAAHFDASSLKSFNDLDKLLKRAKAARADKRKWLFVIGIEQYEYTDNIAYARRSAEMFVKTAQKVLGVPKQNSYIMLNAKASQAHIKTNLKKMLRRVQSGDTIYFYYNGHGVPVPSRKNEPYLLASNTEPDFVQDEPFFALQNIYSKLSDSKAGKIVAVVDSCFSGVTDGKAVLKGVAATRVVAKRTKFNQKKMVVLTAGKGHQYSNAYNKKGHRLFSFFVMKNMLEGKRDVKELYKATKEQTYETSFKEYGDLRVQEPTIEGNARMEL